MYKKIKWFQIIIIIIVGYFFIGCLDLDVVAADAIKENKKKIIYIVYDNSSSTYDYGKQPRSFWSEINYGVQAFYTMTNKDDVIRVCFMSSEDNLEMNGYSGNAMAKTELDRIREIELHPVSGSVTDIERVKRAINELDSISVDNGEKWIVIFTDGELEDSKGKPYEKKEAAERLLSYLNGKTNIQMCYVPISSAAVNDYLDKDRIFQPEETKDVAKQLLEVCNHIYGRRTLQNVIEQGYEPAMLKGEKLEVTFDIPVSDCMLYAYCDGANVGELQGDIIWCEKVQPPKELNLISGQALEDAVSIEKTGFIAAIDIDSSQNNASYIIEFPLDVQDVSYEIYYEPAIEVIPLVLQNNDYVVEGNYLEGEYEVKLACFNRVTGEVVDSLAHFLKAEEFVAEVSGSSRELIPGSDANQWAGTAEAGNMVVQVSTTGITGETNIEVYKDYAQIELVAELEELYFMDLLEQKEQCVCLRANLDGINVTDELQELIESKNKISLTCYLEKDGKRYNDVEFEQHYDVVARCWKLYPFFVNEVDYFMGGEYEFHVLLEINTEYYNDIRSVSLKAPESFCVGVSEGKVHVSVGNPWECKIQNLFWPTAPETEINLEWNGEKLPSSVFGDILIAGTENGQLGKEYQILGKDKNKLKIKGNPLWAFWQRDVEDCLTVQGYVTLFGQQREIFNERIVLELYGLSTWQRISSVVFWLLVLSGMIFGIVWVISFWIDIKGGRRFPLGTKVYRSYKNGRNPLKGKVSFPLYKKRGLLNEKYVEYTLRIYLPKEFGMGNTWFKIKVRRLQKHIKILDMQKPPGCKAILLGETAYYPEEDKMSGKETIHLIGEKNSIEIRVECVW